MTPLDFDRVGRDTAYQDPPAFATEGPNLTDPLERGAILLWTYGYETPNGAQALLHHGGAPAANTWRAIAAADRRLYRLRADLVRDEFVRVVELSPPVDEHRGEPQPADTLDEREVDPLALDPLSPTAELDLDDDAGFQPLGSKAIRP